MKRQTISSLVASVAVALCGIPAEVQAGPTGSSSGSDCKSLAANLRKAVAANPSRVLIFVEDAMIANGDCACDIVKAAIQGSGADAGTPEATDLIKQIVQTAITANPSMSAVIVECAMAVSPGKSADIRAAVADTLGDSEDFVPSPEVRGIYLIPPVASGAVLVQQVFEKAHGSDKSSGKGKDKKTVIEREVLVVPPPVPRVPVSPSSAD